jgi:probable F420-dependent oxidoreductase
MAKPFRFSMAAAPAQTRTAWIEQARKAEAYGYDTFWMGDHIAWGGLAPIPALMAAAAATTTLRVGCHVFCNDLRNPVMLAAEAATLDVLSDGRCEFGLGCGWLAHDYQATGVPFERGAIRVRRLAEAIRLIKRLWAGETVDFDGEFYHVHGCTLNPLPIQQTHLPIFIGGGAKQTLSLAACEADIVGLDLRSTANGGKDLERSTRVLEQNIGWIREAAGNRFAALDIELFTFVLGVSANRRKSAEQWAATFATWPAEIMANPPNADEIFASKQSLIGTAEEIIEQLHMLRECYGINYISVPFDQIESFQPVVSRLAGA